MSTRQEDWQGTRAEKQAPVSAIIHVARQVRRLLGGGKVLNGIWTRENKTETPALLAGGVFSAASKEDCLLWARAHWNILIAIKYNLSRQGLWSFDKSGLEVNKRD